MAPMLTISFIQNYLNETIIRDSNPLKFVLILLLWVGTGLFSASIGGFGISQAQKHFVKFIPSNSTTRTNKNTIIFDNRLRRFILVGIGNALSSVAWPFPADSF